MKDGRILTGSTHPAKSVMELPLEKKRERAGVQSEKILIVDDELRRIFIPQNSILDLQPDEIGASLEIFQFPQRINRNPREQVAALETFRQSTPFDEFGRRTIFVGGSTPLIQAITAIAPHYIKVEGLNYNIDMRLSPYSIPRERLSQLLKKQLNPKSLDDRLRVYQYYVQAELYEQAAAELVEIIRDFQSDKGDESRLETGLQLIRQLAAQRLLDELKLRQQSGQYRKVRMILSSFETEGVSQEKIQAIRRMASEMDEQGKKCEQILTLLQEEAEKVSNADLKTGIEPILREIKRELNRNTMDRFAEFLLAQNDSTLDNDARLAIGLSGWLAGSQATDNRLEIAVSMYRVRRLMRRYLLEKLPDYRESLWKEIQAEEAATPERVAQMLRVMKPPQSTPASSRQTPGLYEVEVPSFDGFPIKYYVQIPPEYDPNRRYPAVISLHSRRTTAKMQLDWWCGPWVSRQVGETVAADQKTPEKKMVNERFGQATRFGYIVIAPVWNSAGTSYRFSAFNHASVLIVMRDALRRFAIDTDHLFLSGHGEGGTATWDIGLSHPDLWAGIIPICGKAVKYAAYLKKNAQFVPVYAVGGELDGGTLNASREVLDWGMDLSKPFDMTCVQFKGRGNESFSDELIRIFEWMTVKERNFFSKEEKTVYSLRPWDNFFWSVELGGFSFSNMTDPTFWIRGKLPADRAAKTEFFKVVGNKLMIKSSADQAIVYLSPEQLDFKQKVEVMYNTHKISPANGTIVPSVRVMLEDARTRCDRLHPFWATLFSETPGKLNQWILSDGKENESATSTPNR